MKKVIKALVIIIAIILVITATIGIFIWTKLNKINYEKISKEDLTIGAISIRLLFFVSFN